MKIDYKNFTLAELESSMKEISYEVELRKNLEADNIRLKIESLLKESGLSIDDVYKEKMIQHKANKVPMKYRHPSEKGIEWSGRGKIPIWMKDLIESGASKEDFLI